MREHLNPEAMGEIVEDFVEQLEALGIRPEGLADRSSIAYLITSWGLAAPGGGVHADRARTILANATSDTVLLRRAQRLMQLRADGRHADRTRAASVYAPAFAPTAVAGGSVLGA